MNFSSSRANYFGLVFPLLDNLGSSIISRVLQHGCTKFSGLVAFVASDHYNFLCNCLRFMSRILHEDPQCTTPTFSLVHVRSVYGL